MKKFIIITDSCCDLPDSTANELNIRVIPMIFTLNGIEYLNYLDGREINYKDFYDNMREGGTSSTAAINMDVFTKCFEEELKQDKDILYLGFSSGLSGTYHVSTIVANELSDKYPDNKIYCVDSLSASMGEGLLVYLAAKEKEKGATIEQVRDFAEEQKMHLCHWFTVDSLDYLKRGGRVTATKAFVASVLNIKPILHVDNEGHLINVDKTRGRKASIQNLFEHMKESAISPSEQTVFLSHGDSEEDAIALKEMIENEFHPKEILINNIGPVIGSHAGPGTLSLFFLGNER